VSPPETKTPAVARGRGVRVWASGLNGPIRVAEDARLREGSDRKDATYGQYGWDWGIEFGSFRTLITQLQGDLPRFTCGNWFFDCNPLKNGELLELAINCHGTNGQVDIDCHATGNNLGMDPDHAWKALTIDTLNSYWDQFKVLDRLLAPNRGVLSFMCCMTGGTDAGTEFLKAVSKILPGRDIMAITTVGICHSAQLRHDGSQRAEPGMRDTGSLEPSQSEKSEAVILADWNDLTKLPWASRNSPHTVIARNGAITGGRGRPPQP
jgi:hypothetical protein